jgi:tRNA pseudouridine38-40 synthase
MRYQALIEYDGTGYFGFQRQRENQPTVQAELETAISHLGRQSISITGAGRTDSGVHAQGQVIAFDIVWTHGVDALRRAINANLPVDIVVLELEETAPTFHPRFDARRRTYAYHIYNAKTRSPIRRLRSWHIIQRLSVENMDRAATFLLGLNDFATFGNPPSGRRTESVSHRTVREAFSASWQRRDDLLVFTIEANAFLHRMVRSIVGSMKLVGEGSWTVEEFVDALQACDRSRAGAVAPAHGLYLVRVVYED